MARSVDRVMLSPRFHVEQDFARRRRVAGPDLQPARNRRGNVVNHNLCRMAHRSGNTG